MIEVNNLSFSYDYNNKKILKNISFKLFENERLCIIGPNGSGKTTLMNIIGCLDKQTEGTFFLDGVDIKACSENEMSDIRLNKIGFVFYYHERMCIAA